MLTTEFGNLLQAARTRANTSGGRLRLLLPHGFAPQVMAYWYATARAQRPSLTLEIRFHRALDELNPEEFDVALQFGHRPPPGPWRCRVMTHVQIRLLASEGYLAAHDRPQSIDDLAEHDVALWVPRVGDEEVLPRRDGASASVEPTMITSNIAMIRWVALSGHAICLLPDPGIADMAEPTGPLRPILDDVVRGTLAVWVVIPEVLADDPNVRWMLDHCMTSVRATLTET